MLFVFPEGPLVTTPPQGRAGGRAWWRRDRLRRRPDRSRYAPPGLVAARAQVIAFLDQLEAQEGIDSGRVILGGFSQGAVLALDVALHDPRSLRGLAFLSGTIVNEPDWFARLSSRRGLPVFIAHSPQDTVLPFVLASACGSPWWPTDGRSPGDRSKAGTPCRRRWSRPWEGLPGPAERPAGEAAQKRAPAEALPDWSRCSDYHMTV